MIDRKRVIYVGMSGGVDSSVAAGLLKKAGHVVRGVFIKPWTPLTAENCQRVQYCNWQQDMSDARQAAAVFGIDFNVWDLSNEYEKLVGRYMISGYEAGVTPNPDVMCNKKIKFGIFIRKAISEGADFIATGHYVRKSQFQNEKGETIFELLKGIDTFKDQSYFLWTLNQEQLKSSLFPVGKYKKSEVRRMAKQMGLLNYNKKDSQGVCFVGKLPMKTFLKNYIEPAKGEIRDQFGAVVGIHDGVRFFTIGQRSNLNITNGGGPYYVRDKDVRRNILHVTSNKLDLLSNGIMLASLSFVNGLDINQMQSEVKIRYRHEGVVSDISIENHEAEVKFSCPQSSISIGQSAVFYQNDKLLGGGIVDKVL